MDVLFTRESAVTFMLVLSRVAGIFVTIPIFHFKNIPGRLKTLFAISIAFMIFLSLPKTAAVPDSLMMMIMSGIYQVMYGMLVGVAISMVFAGIQAAGSLIDYQIGFGMSSLIDPSTGVQNTIISRWFNFVAIMIFFAIGGHRWLILGLINSFKITPVDQYVLTPGFIEFLFKSFSDIIKIGFNVAAPVLIALILIDVATGVIAKTAPRLNLLLLTMPFKIILGLAILIVAMSSFSYTFALWLGTLKDPLMKFFYI